MLIVYGRINLERLPFNIRVQCCTQAKEAGCKDGESCIRRCYFQTTLHPTAVPSDLSTPFDRQPGMSERRARLVALIEHLNAGIGNVIQPLKRAGLYDNIIIVFSSDNGGRLDLGPIMELCVREKDLCMKVV